MEKHKACSFFGHREISLTEGLKERTKAVIEELIVNRSVRTFLFGSRSEFNTLCHYLVTELREKYSFIKRISYTCKSETCILESEREEWEEIYSRLQKKEVFLLGVEEEVEHKTKYTAGKASYVERNQAMIDDSDFCVFYYDEQNLVINNKRKGKSGTAIAYDYAKRKKKVLINLFSV